MFSRLPNESVRTTGGFTPVGSSSQTSNRSLTSTERSSFVHAAIPHGAGSPGVLHVSCSNRTPVALAVMLVTLPVATW